MFRLAILVVLLVSGSRVLADDIAAGVGAYEVGATATPSYFSQPDPRNPNAIILTMEPPQAAASKGIQQVIVTAVDGRQMPSGTERMFRLNPGVHQISFVRPMDPDVVRTLEVEVKAGSAYSIGWRPVVDDWEPVIFDVAKR